MLDRRDNEAQARSTQVPATVFSFLVSALGSMVSIAAACYSMLQPLKPQPNHAKATVARATCHGWLDGNGYRCEQTVLTAGRKRPSYQLHPTSISFIAIEALNHACQLR